MIRYSNDAENDIAIIADYATDEWGQDQAERYISEIDRRIEQIEKMPGMGRACLDIHPGLYRIEEGQHTISYLPVPNGIFICRVLHKRMLVGYEDFLSSFSESIE